MALIVTKADLLAPGSFEAESQMPSWLKLDMTRHTLETHCPWQGIFAISSLGGLGNTLQPRGLDRPLVWLAESLQAQDEARIAHLWQLRR